MEATTANPLKRGSSAPAMNNKTKVKEGLTGVWFYYGGAQSGPRDQSIETL